MTQTYSGGCQCGKVRYEVSIEISEVLACNCSRCGRLGSLLAFAPANQFELLSGDADLTMLSEEYPERGVRGPRSLGGTSIVVHLHVADVDAAFAQAVDAGATVLRPLQDQFYGERSGTVRDPFGHEWLLGGHLETVTPEEMQRRYTALFTK